MENSNRFHHGRKRNQESGRYRNPISAGEVLLRHIPQRSPPLQTIDYRGNGVNSDSDSLYPCRNAINSHMREHQTRVDTFLTWERSIIQAQPEELAEAGLFYTGERDAVKCWYCNGGLLHWEYNDDPWFEHAKWYPLCEYLLQKKGSQYVRDITARFQDLRRPTIRNPSLREVVSGIQRYPLPSGPVTVIDPRQEMRNIQNKVEREMRDSQLTTNAFEMGFERHQIKAAYKRRFETHNSPFKSFEQLVDAIHSNNDPINPSDDFYDKLPEYNLLGNSSPHEELRKLEGVKRCKICHTRDVNILFLPCGHLASCSECSVNASICHICRAGIRQKVRTFRS